MSTLDDEIIFRASVDMCICALVDRIIPKIRRLERMMFGPIAPPRRRPRRIAKRIRQRCGRLRHSPFNPGCKRPRSA